MRYLPKALKTVHTFSKTKGRNNAISPNNAKEYLRFRQSLLEIVEMMLSYELAKDLPNPQNAPTNFNSQ